MQVPVLIVGGGPIGLTASVMLGRRGIDSLLVNARPTTSVHPRARYLDVRTSEILDQIGLYEDVAATGLPAEWLDSVRYSTRFSEPELLRLPTASYDSAPRDISALSPIMTAQDLVEPILLDAARSFAGNDVRFGCELISLEAGPDVVRAVVRPVGSGDEITVDAQWVIGADGRASTVRSLGGCGLNEGVVGRNSVQDVLYHADMSPWVGDRKGALLFAYHPMGYGLFQPMDGEHRWRAQCTTFTPAVAQHEVTEELCVRWIRSAIGDDDESMDIDVLGIAPWLPEERLANRFRNGRILLVGDAAHTIFPTGGYGMNLGYHGVHNLVWKLVAVIEGQANGAILDTYEQERRPQVQLTLETATENARRAGAMYRAYLGGGDRDHARDQLMQYGNFDGMILAPEYQSPLCAPETGPGPAVENRILDFEPVVRSGRRAPHVFLDAEGSRSVLDLFGTDYVLLVPEGQLAHAQVFDPIAVEVVPVAAAAFATGVYRNDEVVLVRPDGIVAGRWPTSTEPHDVASQVTNLLYRS